MGARSSVSRSVWGGTVSDGQRGLEIACAAFNGPHGSPGIRLGFGRMASCTCLGFTSRLSGGSVSSMRLTQCDSRTRRDPMNEHQLRGLIDEVKSGKLPRRGFIQQMVGLGLSAPMASMMLMHAGVAQAQTTLPYKPTKRGGGGTLKLLWWQGPVHLSPHWATGTKEQEGCRIFYEPLACLGRRGQPGAGARHRGPDARQRRPVGRRQDGDLEAQARRHLARRPALHRRRRGLHLGVRQGPRDLDDHRRHLQGYQGRQDRLAHGARHVSESRRRSGPSPSSAPWA